MPDVTSVKLVAVMLRIEHAVFCGVVFIDLGILCVNCSPACDNQDDLIRNKISYGKLVWSIYGLFADFSDVKLKLFKIQNLPFPSLKCVNNIHLFCQ